MSEFKIEVVQIGPVVAHPNADSLMITEIHGGYPVIFRRGQFVGGDLAVYVPVDAVVPTTHPQFTFLQPTKGPPHARVKAKRLRGIFSMGLLVPIEPGMRLGDDVQKAFGIEKYEPKRTWGHSGGGDIESSLYTDVLPEYTDIEGLRRWPNVLQNGEEVVLTEKVHGCSSRFVWALDRLWVGSHHTIRRPPHTVTVLEQNEWERAMRRHARWLAAWKIPRALFGKWFARSVPPPKAPRQPQDVSESVWWHVARTYRLEEKMHLAPGKVLFGEVYGPVQDLHYGTQHTPQFRAFDIFDLGQGCYLDFDDFMVLMTRLEIPTVPVLYRGPWNDTCRLLAEGQSTIEGADHVREGIVIRPVRERRDPGIGRVILKLVGENYLLR